MPHSILQSSTEDDTFAALTGTRVKFWIDPGYGLVGQLSWEKLIKFFREDYDIDVPTKENPLYLVPNHEYSHLLIMVGQLMGKLRRDYDALLVFFINHEHGH